jgi:hypothetical protein
MIAIAPKDIETKPSQSNPNQANPNRTKTAISRGDIVKAEENGMSEKVML